MRLIPFKKFSIVMKRMFKIGDRVEVKDDDIKGIVSRVDGNCITFVDEHGFEWKYSVDELVITPDLDIENLNTFSLIHKEDVSKAKRKNKIFSNKNEKVLDLHAEKIPPRYFYHRSVLEGQIKYLRDQLKKMKTGQIGKWIIIHGEGSGKLKKEVLKILRSEGYEVYEASYRHYGKGATIAEKKQN